jgi:hypothetical protein
MGFFRKPQTEQVTAIPISLVPFIASPITTSPIVGPGQETRLATTKKH